MHVVSLLLSEFFFLGGGVTLRINVHLLLNYSVLRVWVVLHIACLLASTFWSCQLPYVCSCAMCLGRDMTDFDWVRCP